MTSLRDLFEQSENARKQEDEAERLRSNRYKWGDWELEKRQHEEMRRVKNRQVSEVVERFDSDIKKLLQQYIEGHLGESNPAELSISYDHEDWAKEVYWSVDPSDSRITVRVFVHLDFERSLLLGPRIKGFRIKGTGGRTTAKPCIDDLVAVLKSSRPTFDSSQDFH